MLGGGSYIHTRVVALYLKSGIKNHVLELIEIVTCIKGISEIYRGCVKSNLQEINTLLVQLDSYRIT